MSEQITVRQSEAAYHVGLEFHAAAGKLGISEAVKKLASTGLNQSSATSLIYAVSWLLSGEVYKRKLSLPVTEDYLRWIHRDRGAAGLQSALLALRAHIEYLEATLGPRKGLRGLMAKYEKLLRVPTAASILMEWRDEESLGYVDVFPIQLFAKEGVEERVRHEVRGPRGGFYEAMCDITVIGAQANLDFEPYLEFNDRQGMLPGASRIIFEDEDRTKIASVFWKARGSLDFEEYPFKQHEFEVPPASDFKPSSEPSEKTARFVRERPGQLAFRRTLKTVYGNRCCVSGCCVPDVLEGAHIDAYQNASSNHVCNGLLLRSDIHTLFDRNLIAIDPVTMCVHVSKSALGIDGYGQWEGLELRLPRDPSHRPDKGTLERRWKLFRRNH